MEGQRFSKIIATGSYLPEKILSNEDLSAIVETTDEWITSRSGIKKRHIISNSQTTSDLAFLAAKSALNKLDKTQKIDMIIVATFSPDTAFPSVACLVAHKLGLVNVPAFDLNAVCSGFIYALATADLYIKSGMANNILVIGADSVSHYVDYSDRATCVLFGDGASCVVLSAINNAKHLDSQIIANELQSDATNYDLLAIKGALKNGSISGRPYIYMDGRSVFKMAVKSLVNISLSILKNNNYTTDQISWIVPHQANLRIIESVAKSLNVSMDRVITTVSEHGNTSAASIPLALDDALSNHKIQRGDIILLMAIGSGFTWGASLIRY